MAKPSTRLSVCIVISYSPASSIATCAPTLRSNVTMPSASSIRIASRTGTTLMPSSAAIWPSTRR